TACNTCQSPVRPELSRMSGLWTRPSVPMMKLIFTLCPYDEAANNGLDVDSACGGWASSHEGLSLMLATVANCEARCMMGDISYSGVNKLVVCRLGAGVFAEKAQTLTVSKRIAGQMRRCMKFTPSGEQV